MSDYEKIQQEIYTIVMDGADAPKPDGENRAIMLLWYEAQLSCLIAERELLKHEMEEDNDFWNPIADCCKSR